MSLRTKGISLPAMTVLGHRKNGAPIYNIAGGSEPLPEPVISIPNPVVEPQAPAPGEEPRFTAKDIERAREQEKDKLYARLQALEEQNRAFVTEAEAQRKEREDRQAAQAEAQRQAAEAARQAAEAEMSAKDLLTQREQEWNDRFSRFEQEREQERALFAKEQEFGRLQSYIQQRVSEERNNIAPELIDLVSGNSPEQVEESLNTLKGKTQAILESVQQAAIQQRSQMRGVSPTGYATTGPMDSDPGHKTFSLQELKDLPMSEYAKIRGSLGIGNAAQNQRGMYS